MYYSFEEFYSDVDIMLSTLWVPYTQVPIGREYNDIFLIEKLGVVVSAVSPGDYSYVLNKLASMYGKHRLIFLSTEDDLSEAKYNVIWDLMRSGYARYLREHYPRQLRNILDSENFTRRIIKERLRCWADQDKYKLLIEENKAALDMSVVSILSSDPAFFDYMPEQRGD